MASLNPLNAMAVCIIHLKASGSSCAPEASSTKEPANPLMKKTFLAFCFAGVLLLSNTSHADLPESHVSLQSKHSVSLTVERMERMLKQTSVRIYGIIDYQELAQTHGGSVRPMRAILFSGGRDSVQLIQTNPAAALDLPLRVLVHEDERGVVWITYHKAHFLIYQHGLTENNVAARRLADGIYSLVKKAAN